MYKKEAIELIEEIIDELIETGQNDCEHEEIIEKAFKLRDEYIKKSRIVK